MRRKPLPARRGEATGEEHPLPAGGDREMHGLARDAARGLRSRGGRRGTEEDGKAREEEAHAPLYARLRPEVVEQRPPFLRRHSARRHPRRGIVDAQELDDPIDEPLRRHHRRPRAIGERPAPQLGEIAHRHLRLAVARVAQREQRRKRPVPGGRRRGPGGSPSAFRPGIENLVGGDPAQLVGGELLAGPPALGGCGQNLLLGPRKNPATYAHALTTYALWS